MNKNYLISPFCEQNTHANTRVFTKADEKKKNRWIDYNFKLFYWGKLIACLGDSQFSKLDWKHLLILQHISVDSCWKSPLVGLTLEMSVVLGDY